MKNFNAFASLMLSTMMLASCSKGVVSTKKLDGEWEVTSGTITTTSTYDDGSSVTTVEEFDGTKSKVTTTYKDANGTTSMSTENDMSISFTFDKKTGDYTMSRVSTIFDESYAGSYYTVEGGDEDNAQYGGSMVAAKKRKGTYSESGLYTLTGDAGDEIEPNSQIVFQPAHTSEDFVTEISYMDEESGAALDPSTTYTQEYNNSGNYDYSKVQTSEDGTESSVKDGVTWLWNVVELKKGEMEVEYTNSNSFTDEDGTSKYENTYTWKLTQK
ncbi:MAG: hypothetical protein R2813_03620 [Flavobacteriales bacterium]